MPGRALNPVRNLFLALLLANILLFAWNRWVVPTPRPAAATVSVAPTQGEAPAPAVPMPPDGDRSATPAASAPPAGTSAALPQPQVAPPPGAAASPAPGDTCVQVGPLPAAEAAAELSRSLASRRIPAATIARDTQVWVGNWIQVGGFASPAAADDARRRLVAGGLADAYLMQEGAEPVISLGVFREKERADRVAAIARGLGFKPVSTNRYRPAVEYWLLARIPAAGARPGDGLPLPRSGLLRVEPAECPLPDTEAGMALAGADAASAADPVAGTPPESGGTATAVPPGGP
jgi:hypothetical protein